MADPLPPNIQEFNAITGVIFALLYVAHPMKDLDAEEIASTLGLSANMPSGRSFLHEMRYIQAYDQ